MAYGFVYKAASTREDVLRSKYGTRHFIDADGFECVAFQIGPGVSNRVVALKEQYEAMKARHSKALSDGHRRGNASRKAWAETSAPALNWTTHE